MSTKMSKEIFLEMKHQKELGVPVTRIAEHFNMSVPTVHKWLRMDEDVVDSYIQNSRPYLEQYRAFILSILKVCPQTQATNIMYRIKDELPDFECGKTAFFKYVKALREETGYVKPEHRETSFREQTKPGYEAQVDFGQYRMKDMYDRNLVIYFFCMVLSYSRMRFVYFSREPFKTKTAIAAHNMAFRYFGGRTETILYDQDKVFVTSEHYGNIVLAAEFERYVKKMGFSVILCNKRDPQTKGKVESFVRYVKEGFLQGRIYSGIDSLNSAALEWLDKECNGTTHDRTRRTPRDMFREESKALTKVHFEDEKCEIRAVSEKYAVIYDWTKYELPHNKVEKYEKIRIEEVDGMLMFYKTENGEMIHKCKKSVDEGGDIPYHDESTKMETVGINSMRRIFTNVPDLEDFINALREQNGRYANRQAGKIATLANTYSIDQVETAISYCVERGICSLSEIQAYLVYRYGLEVGRGKIPASILTAVRRRAAEIAEEQNDRLK